MRWANYHSTISTCLILFLKTIMTRKTLYKIDVDVFDFQIYIVYSKQDQFDKILKRISPNFSELDGEVVQWICCTYQGRKICIWIFDVSKDKKATLVHELSHAVDWIINFMNLWSDRDHTETRANLMEYVYKKALSYKLL